MKITSTKNGFSAEFTAENGTTTELQFDAVKKEDETFIKLTAHPHWGDPVEFAMSPLNATLLSLKITMLAAELELTEKGGKIEAAQS